MPERVGNIEGESATARDHHVTWSGAVSLVSVLLIELVSVLHIEIH